MVPISFAVAAGLFTILGLYVYLLFIRSVKSNLMAAMSLPFFVALFVAGPVMGCAMVLILQLRDSTRPVHGALGYWTLLAWMATVGLGCIFDRRRLWGWLKAAAGLVQPGAETDTAKAPASVIHRFGYVPAWDGLRGVAILEVMGSHFTTWAGGGYYGVSIFFVISGFLITSLFLREFALTNTISLARFYRRRVLRLIPALGVMLATYCLVAFFVSGPDGGWSSCKQTLLPLFFLANWNWALNIYVPTSISQTWSLSVEEQFYFVWPLILLLMLRVFPGRRRLMALIAGGLGLFSWLLRACLCAQGADLDHLYLRSDTRADALMAGCALALALSAGPMTERTQQRLKGWLRFLTPVAAVGLVLASSRGQIHGPATYYWGFLLVQIFTVVLILDLGVGGCGWLRNFLAMRWLAWVGSISYGLYLWHQLVLHKVDALDFNVTAKIVASVLVPFFIATISYRTIAWKGPFCFGTCG